MMTKEYISEFDKLVIKHSFNGYDISGCAPSQIGYFTYKGKGYRVLITTEFIFVEYSLDPDKILSEPFFKGDNPQLQIELMIDGEANKTI